MHEQRLSVQLSTSGSPQDEKENVNLTIRDNNRNGNCNATVSTTSIASQSVTIAAMEDEMFLLEVSDRFIDISNLISRAAPIERSVSVAIGGDDDNSDDESLPKSITLTFPMIYPDMHVIDDMNNLDVNEFLPTTRKIQSTGSRHSTTENYSEYAASNASSLHSIAARREAHAPLPTHSHPTPPSQDFPPSRTNQRFQGTQQHQHQHQQQYQQQNHSQRISSRNLSSSNHHDSYSDSSFFDSPSIDEVGSLNNDDSHNDNRTRSLRQLGMTRQQSIMAMQRAISGRQGDEDRLPQAHPPTLQKPPQQQQPRPTLRSQQSFNSHSLSYRNLGGAGNLIPNSSADLDHHAPRNRMDANNYIISSYKNNNANNDNMRHLQNSIPSIDDEVYDDFDVIQSHHGANEYHNRTNINHGRGSRPDSYQSLMTQPQHMRQRHLEQHQQDRYTYNGNFQLQRGRQHQSERGILNSRFEVNQNQNGFDDTNRTALQQQQSHSYRHAPTHTPYSSGSPNNRTIQSYQPTHRNSTHAIPPIYTDSSSSSSSRNSSQPLTLEISPGVFATVRGANETEHAVATNRLIHVQCMACTLHISCIADAQYVLCPVCKSIGPTQTTITNGAGGVGLGFVTDR